AATRDPYDAIHQLDVHKTLAFSCWGEKCWQSPSLKRGDVHVADAGSVIRLEPHLAPEVADDDFGKIDVRVTLSTAQSTRTKDIALHQFVIHDIEADKKHSISYQFRTHHFHQLQHLFGDFHAFAMPSRVHVATRISGRVDAAKGRVFSLVN